MSIRSTFILKAQNDEQKEQCFALRKEVFVTEQCIPLELEIDAEDETCDHYLLLCENLPAGAARVIYQKDRALIGRLVVLAAHRGKGFGQMLMRRMLADIATHGLKRVELGAQVTAQDFYRKSGFMPYGSLYDDAGIPHIHMRLTLSDRNAS